MNELTTTTFDLSQLELRGTAETGLEVEGIAVPYGEWSIQMGSFIEKLAPGSITLAERGVFALYQHDTKQVLGSTKNETLKLELRDTGLHFKLNLPDTTLGIDVAKQVKRKDLRGVSVGMLVQKDSWLKDEKRDVITRTVLKTTVFEVSLTPYPAYEQSGIAFREALYAAAVKALDKKPESFPLPTDQELAKLRAAVAVRLR